MLIALIVVLALSCLFFGVRFIKAMEADDQEKATVLKGLTTICCILIALIAYFMTPLTKFALLVILGLIFGFIGDELLALRFVYTKKFSAFFLSGALAFLIGHIFYLIALYGLAPRAWMLSVPLTLAALAAEFINSKKHSLDMGKLFLPLGFYAAVVCFMGCSAVGVCVFHFNFGTPLFAVARVAGWSAHRIEEIVAGGRIYRPAYKSVLPLREYVPINERTEAVVEPVIKKDEGAATTGPSD